MDVDVLIPAYKPDHRLVELANTLIGECPLLLVIDDGSGEEFEQIFSELKAMGVVVLSHEQNLGKGAALKTGLKYLAQNGSTYGVVTADSDGQHSLEDILRIAVAMHEHPDALILGGREFKQMPLRSRVGNTITRFFFRAMTGLRISDTQTGLRGLPHSMYPKLIATDGERYEYEMNMLLSLKEWNDDYLEIPIQTIYHDNNSGSHFHALRDGARVFSRVLKYSATSLICTALDYALYCLMLLLVKPQYSYLIARVISASVNYQLCRRVVFQVNPSVWRAVGYSALALVSMLIGATGVGFLSGWGLNSLLAKIVLDTVLFVVNYMAQKYIIFR
ncbi:MAG: bifunctional glycosyltransferase family 2/GtrA family protein [Clostridia bacterium]